MASVNDRNLKVIGWIIGASVNQSVSLRATNAMDRLVRHCRTWPFSAQNSWLSGSSNLGALVSRRIPMLSTERHLLWSRGNKLGVVMSTRWAHLYSAASFAILPTWKFGKQIIRFSVKILSSEIHLNLRWSAKYIQFNAMEIDAGHYPVPSIELTVLTIGGTAWGYVLLWMDRGRWSSK